MVKGYRLKDKEFQKKLDELTDGDFSKKLMKPLSRCLPDVYVVECGDVINKKLKSRYWVPRFCVHFKENELEKIHEYDPNSWNDYPAVKPPDGIWMRFEFTSVGVRHGRRMMYSCGEWGYGFGTISDLPDDVKDARFRPWDETERRMR